MADPKTDAKPISFTDDKKTATVTATKHIPLSLLFAGGKVPDKFAKHPGGARVEKGVAITVSEEGAAYLKKIGYAK
ncbi:MAG: hypothetical protein CMM84_16140 [Rhodothermaceae bacterium]|nr:hypothetical protein [Rhodothermaceae bacterium]MBC12525.1 hypothetical protein [Rhodothermaceae bacterium]